MKKFLFPFSTEKYKFLETKWWHRLMKIIFFLIIGIGFFSSIMLYSEMVDKEPKVQVSMDSKATDFSDKEIKFMKLAKEQGYNPEETLNFINEKRSEGHTIRYYLQIGIYTIITAYILSILLQLIYFKGIIYVIYGNGKNK